MVRSGVEMRFWPGCDVSINAVGRVEYEDGSFILKISPNSCELYPDVCNLIHVSSLQNNYILNVRIGYADF